MLQPMTHGRPDSASIAGYAADYEPAGQEQELRESLRSDETIDWGLLAKRIAAETGGDVRVQPLAPDSASLTSARRQHASPGLSKAPVRRR